MGDRSLGPHYRVSRDCRERTALAVLFVTQLRLGRFSFIRVPFELLSYFEGP